MRRSSILCLVAAALLALPAVPAVAAELVVTSVQPTVVQEGDVVEILGQGFDADPSRYSVLLRDGAGIVAWSTVSAAGPQGLSVTIHGVGRASSDAVLEIREGVSVPLFAPAQTEGVELAEATWFQGSGAGASWGSMIVVGGAPTESLARHPESENVAAGKSGSGCPVVFIGIPVPTDCREITVRVTVGGHDPFGGFSGSLKSGGGLLFDSWQALLEAKVTLPAATSSRPDTVLAQLLTSHFGPFGLQAEEVFAGDDFAVSLHGPRITDLSSGALIDLRCEEPKKEARRPD